MTSSEDAEKLISKLYVDCNTLNAISNLLGLADHGNPHLSEALETVRSDIFRAIYYIRTEDKEKENKNHE